MNTDFKKAEIFTKTRNELSQSGFSIDKEDQNRPWGGFFVINEEQAKQFAQTYFESIDVDALKISGKLSPKFLVVAPQKRLSWQYHFRRAEIWKVISGSVGVITSHTDEEGTLQILGAGEIIRLKQGERHRLVGLDDWSILAEIWQHTDINNPSDEDDIVRVQDDFGR